MIKEVLDAYKDNVQMELASNHLPSKKVLLKTNFKDAYSIERQTTPQMFDLIDPNALKYDIVHLI